MSENTWGYKDLTQWALIRRAPYSASGLNEIIATGRTKDQMNTIATALGLAPKARNGFAVIRVSGKP